jgi:hypothetical protein
LEQSPQPSSFALPRSARTSRPETNFFFSATLNNDALSKGICLGYVEAVADFVRYSGYRGIKYCADPNVTAQQMMDIPFNSCRLIRLRVTYPLQVMWQSH